MARDVAGSDVEFVGFLGALHDKAEAGGGVR